MGPAWFLYFLGIISLSLGIMNLLPIPILDGGHQLYYLIELVKGNPLSEGAMAAGQYMGMALLVMLMGIAFYNDILRVLASRVNRAAGKGIACVQSETRRFPVRCRTCTMRGL